MGQNHWWNPADLIEVFTCSFKAAKIKVQVDGCSITLLAIYYPLYSTVNPVTEIMFIDFIKWIWDQLIMSEHRNKLLFLGEFNICVNDKFDENAGYVMDIIIMS